MDAARYARIRELFLATEDLLPPQQQEFLIREVGDDRELLDEVNSLLDEHSAEFAKIEGESAVPVAAPIAAVTEFGSAAKPSGDTTRRGDSKDRTNPKSSKPNRKKNGDGAITKHGAQRTHASPRHKSTTPPKSNAGNNQIWAARTRINRRRNSGWLWLAALLPTALIGWWTYRQVETMIEQTVRTELKGIVDSVALSADRFLAQRVGVVQSWSRQTRLRQAVEELNAIAKSDPPLEQLRESPLIDEIHQQLRELSGSKDVKFIIWNDSYRTIASWSTDVIDVGRPIHPKGAANLARVLSGESVVAGPERLVEAVEGYLPESDRPMISVIVPIRDAAGDTIASMMVRSIGMFDEFNQIFAESSVGGQLDAYAINRDGLMITESVHAVSMATLGQFDLPAEQIAAKLRVSDPGVVIDEDNAGTIVRQVRPVTVAVAGAIGGERDVRTVPYPNYCGEPVVGAWRWLDGMDIGVIVEESADRAFGPARVVRFSFLTLGSLLTLTAFLAATKIARTSTADHAAIHPLSRYEIQEQLGSGGLGVVYKARHNQLGRDTAMKVLRGDRHNHEDRLRFDREARLAASLSNPHSVQIYDYGHSDEGEAYCVMQFLRGLTLQEVVSRSGHQPIGRMLFVLRQICDALGEAHSLGLLHRDIKPQNIMLSLDPSVGDWGVVFDFGLAKPLQPDAGVYQTSETVWAGTPMYMAPERFRQPGVMDPRSDIYSVGCVAYYLLCGRPPFIESDPESLFALILSEQPIGIAIHRGQQVPAAISDMVFKCMAKRADDRYATIAELCRVIDHLRVDHPWSIDEARVWWGHHG